MRRAEPHADERGQVLVIAALMLTALIGFAGVGLDIGWYQLNVLRIQRAADAAALAGVVHLPGNPAGAFAAARAEATKNGYADGVSGVTVSAAQDPVNNRLMVVTIRARARTFFAQLFGFTSFPAERRARAEFILPVPMGSPQDYFGIATLCANSGACTQVTGATGSVLASQGFWGSILTKGAQRANGDAYSTYYNSGAPGGLNAAYDDKGYSYVVEFPPGTVNGAVWIFDPVFCATGRKTANPNAGQRLGVGDFWYSTAGTRNVTTEFKLWDMLGTPYTSSDDLLIASDNGLFANMDNVDKGPSFAGDQNYGAGYNGSGSNGCQSGSAHPSSAFHNTWWLLATGLGAGQYRLQVVTGGGSTSQNANNEFGIQVTSPLGGGRIYGQSRMCAYINVVGTSLFYLAQVDAVHAGKTLEIRLFDPGDFSNTTLRIKQPMTTGYTNATFSYTAENGRSGTNITSLVTHDGTSNLFQNAWVTITIPLPASYSAPTPPGEPGAGWWKIEYQTAGSGVDVTTWEVNIRGNPVHLVTP